MQKEWQDIKNLVRADVLKAAEWATNLGICSVLATIYW